MHVFIVIFSIPFILVLPGWFLAAICFPASDRIEKSTISVLLSITVVSSILFLIEKICGKLTPSNTLATVFFVNLTTFLLFVVMKFLRRAHRDT